MAEEFYEKTWQEADEPLMHNDNRSTIDLANNPFIMTESSTLMYSTTSFAYV